VKKKSDKPMTEEEFQQSLINMVNKGTLYYEMKNGEPAFQLTEEGIKEYERYKYYEKHIKPLGGLKHLIGKKCPICSRVSTETNDGIYDEKTDEVICYGCWFEYKKKKGYTKNYDFEERL